MSKLLTFENPVFASFAFASSVVIAKTFAMVFVTVYQRTKNRVSDFPEDMYFKQGEKARAENSDGYQAVDRARRNHLNDLENIPFFCIIGGLYVMTDPSPSIAMWHFRIFALGRILHTIGFQTGNAFLRGLPWGLGYFACLSMVGQVMYKSLQ